MKSVNSIQQNQRTEINEISDIPNNTLLDSNITSDMKINNEPTGVIIISSTPRSGSTLLGELLASRNKSIYYFEPLHSKQKSICRKDEKCTQKLFEDLLTCKIPKSDYGWLLSFFSKYLGENVQNCLKLDKTRRGSCLKSIDLNKECQTSNHRILKTIRARLNVTEYFLKSHNSNIKIIYLSRDPRGAMNSIRKFPWDNSPNLHCTNILSDIITYEDYSSKYPLKLFWVKYEDLASKPFQTIKGINKFLYNEESIPNSTINYINTHMIESSKPEKNSAMNTKKNSRANLEKWRLKIPLKLLVEINKTINCLSVFEKMGYKNFMYDDVRNVNISIEI